MEFDKIEEFFAEAFREYTHSSNPRKYAKMIGEGIEQAFDKIRKKVP